MNLHKKAKIEEKNKLLKEGKKKEYKPKFFLLLNDQNNFYIINLETSNVKVLEN